VDKCDNCDGLGYLFPWGEDTGYVCIEKCDQCDMFKCDDEAASYVAARLLELDTSYAVAYIVITGMKWIDAGSARYVVLRSSRGVGCGFFPIDWEEGVALERRLATLLLPGLPPRDVEPVDVVKCPWIQTKEGGESEFCRGEMVKTSTAFHGDHNVYEHWQCKKCDRKFLRHYKWGYFDGPNGRLKKFGEQVDAVWFGTIKLPVVVEYMWHGESGVDEMIGSLIEDVEYVDVDENRRAFWRGHRVLARRHRLSGGTNIWMLLEMVNVSWG